jgi:hypothetical protein
MPATVVTGADATGTCRDPSCRGHHEPKRIGAELRVDYWTQRVGGGPVTIARTERQPIEFVVETTCEYCGSELDVVDLANSPRGVEPKQLVWPVPSIGPGHTSEPDEILPDPQIEWTLEEQVKDLQRRVGWLEGRLRR